MILDTVPAAEPIRGRAATRIRRPGAGAGAFAYGVLMGGALFWLARRALPDDAMITLSYARNLALYGEWALTPGLPANTATSPLNVWLEAALIVVTGRPVVALGLLLVLTVGLIAFWLQRIGGLRPMVVGTLLVVANPLVASAAGLEVFLTIAAIVGSVRFGVPGRWRALGLVGAAALLIRPDLAVVVVALLGLWAAHHRQWRGPLVSSVLTITFAAPWYGWSWVTFGSAVPDTLAVKSDAGDSWGGFTYVDGLGHYLGRWPLQTEIVLAGLTVGVVAFVACLARLAQHRRLGALGWAGVGFGVAGLAHYAAMSALGGAPFFWYYTPAVAGAALCGVVVLESVLRRGPRTPLALGTTVVVGSLALGTIAYDLGRGAPWDGMAPIRINWATPAQYEDIARGLPEGATVESPGEIGYLAFHCRCRVVDYFADPGRMVSYIERFRATHDSTFWNVNYRYWEPVAPVPAQYRVVYEFSAPDGPGQWPTTFPADRVKRMRLEPIPSDQL